jgi:hypothetical protein
VTGTTTLPSLPLLIVTVAATGQRRDRFVDAGHYARGRAITGNSVPGLKVEKIGHLARLSCLRVQLYHLIVVPFVTQWVAQLVLVAADHYGVQPAT